ncbi:MAG: hypothetical protein LBR38_04745 [Synergistaceae bacterium]|jgi:hypothetical protein|nr:hypothetical protein [Synergistaceae bacterium]
MTEVREYFRRHFLGVVNVNQLPTAMAPPGTASAKRAVATHSLRAGGVGVEKMTVATTPLLSGSRRGKSGSGLRAYGRSFVPASQFAPRVHRPSLASFGSPVPHHVPLMRALVPHEAVRRALVVPQERTNRLQWLKASKRGDKPAPAGWVHMAWFWPIVSEAVVKFSLNKQRGTLLVWYNPQSRRFDAHGLHLYAKFGARDGMDWRWE